MVAYRVSMYLSRFFRGDLCNGRRKYDAGAILVSREKGCVSRPSASRGASRSAPRPLPPERGTGRGAYVNTHATPVAAATPLSVLERPHVGPPLSQFMWITQSSLPCHHRSHCHHRFRRL
ncbi:unnamed protein product [Leptosia nina]|uniref:Uncharacterized protein n=1 Tax=Leptosia nina TaxID=320188 RepID=A0AAV1K741_9NEOP